MGLVNNWIVENLSCVCREEACFLSNTLRDKGLRKCNEWEANV